MLNLSFLFYHLLQFILESINEQLFLKLVQICQRYNQIKSCTICGSV